MGFGSIKCFKWYHYCQSQSVTENDMHGFCSALLWHHPALQKCWCLSVFQILTLLITLVIKNHIVLWLAKLMKPGFLLSYEWLPCHLYKLQSPIESSPITGIFINYFFIQTPWCLLWGELILRTPSGSQLCLSNDFHRTQCVIRQPVKFHWLTTKFKSY